MALPLAPALLALALAAPPGGDPRAHDGEVLAAVGGGNRAAAETALARAQLAHGRDAGRLYLDLTRFFIEDDPNVRSLACHALEVLTSPEMPQAVAEKLAERLIVDKESQVRISAAVALRRWAESAFRPVGGGELPPPAERLRIPKARAAVVAKALGTALSDPNASVRPEAAGALGALGGPQASAQLRAGLKHKDPLVRQACAQGIGDSADTGAGKLLVPLLKDDAEGVRLAAARSLVLLDDKEAGKAVEQLAKSSAADQRQDAARLAGGSTAPWSAKVLAKLMDDPDWHVQVAAAAGLASRGDKKARAWLVLRAPKAGSSEQLEIETQLAKLHVTDAERRELATGSK
jgi:HEAT repeat protein